MSKVRICIPGTDSFHKSRQTGSAVGRQKPLARPRHLSRPTGSYWEVEGDKPLECVGEIKESRAAMRLAQQQYPELAKYKFELPDDYDYRALMGDEMPPDIRMFLTDRL